MSEEQRELQQVRSTIEFGLDTQQFMGTSLGRFLCARANAQIDAAREALGEVDPEDPKAIRKLQNDVAVASMFLLWIGEIVTEGENAERQAQEAEN
jgi:hypothetical protein